MLNHFQNLNKKWLCISYNRHNLMELFLLGMTSFDFSSLLSSSSPEKEEFEFSLFEIVNVRCPELVTRKSLLFPLMNKIVFKQSSWAEIKEFI